MGSRLWVCLWLVASTGYPAQVELLQQATVDIAALTFADGDQTRFGNFPNGITHQQFPLRTYRGYQYVVYYDDDRQVCVGRRKLTAGAWDIVRLTDYHITSHDTHNVAVIGICENDGTIHLAFDHHASDLHYRRSSVGVADDPEAFAWDASLFGPTTNVLGPLGVITLVTYPRFVSTPGGDLLLYYRYLGSGNGDGMLRMYDGTTSQWSTGRGKFIARDIGTYTFGGATSDFRNPYLNGIGYAGNRLHVSWIWRDLFSGTSADNQHDLCYAYSDDDGLTWKNSAGTQIGITGSSPIHLDSPGLVVAAIDPGTELSNSNTQYAYPDGGVHVMLRHYEAGSSTPLYHHHWRDAAGTWHFESLVFSGPRPELLGDDQRNLFLIYTSNGRLRIAKGVPNAGRTAWSWSMIYQQSVVETTGGDGQIDATRWHGERVLSSYHQEKPSTIIDYGSGTPVDGLPTPLHVTDFQVTLYACRPNPAHESVRVATTNGLAWTAGLDALSHRIYVGTDPQAVASATPASPEYRGEQSEVRYMPEGAFAAQTTYYWRIDEVEADATVRQGLLWAFTTWDYSLTISAVPDQITPFNTPTPPIPFAVTDGTNSVDALVLHGASTDQVLVPDDNIVFGGSGHDRTVTVTPAAGQFGDAGIALSVSNGSESTGTVFRFTVLPSGVVTDTLYSHPADSTPLQIDGQPPSILESIAGEATLYAGRGGPGGTVDRCVVFPFELPALGPTANPFTEASFSFNLVANNLLGRRVALDLYGLTNRASATVLATDFYSETDVADPAPGAIRLQDNLCTPLSVVGSYSNSPAGSSALVDYLNAQYAGGANAGNFVFLRLNKDGATGLSFERYTVTAADGAAVANEGLPDYSIWPQIQYSAVVSLLPAPPVVAAAGPTNGVFSMVITGDGGPDYVVEASTNLTTWLPVWTNSAPPPLIFADPDSTNFSHRAYRVLLNP